MKLRNRQTRVAAALAAIALVVAACGSGDAPAAGPVNPSPTEVPGSPAPSELDTDATLVFQAYQYTETLDPDATTSGYELNLLFNAYDRLIHVDAAKGELAPGLAVSWETMKDNTVLRLKLREGVVFHDGEPFDAQAVVANLERTRNHVDGRQESTGALKAVASWEIVDKFTIDFIKDAEEAAAWAILLPNLTVGLGVMISPAAINGGVDLTREIVGAGPYRFVANTAQGIILERFDEYWDPSAAGVARMEILRPSSAQAHLSGVISGEIDLTQIDPEQIGQAEAAGLTVIVQPTLRVWHLYMNHNLPPLDDPNIRKAFLYAIDRAGLVEAITGGTGTPTPQYFPEGYYAFDPDHGEEAYPYDPDRARALVESSSYFKDGGVEIEMEVVNTPESRVRLSELIQDYLGRVGINAKFTPVSHSAATDFRGGAKHIDLGPRSRLDPLQHLSQSLDRDGNTNPGGFTTDALQGLLDQAASLPASERAAVVRQISAMQTAEAFGVTLYAESEIWAYRCVEGFVPPLATFFSLAYVGMTRGCQ